MLSISHLWQGRDLYIWGAAQLGRDLNNRLTFLGHRPQGFLDNNQVLVGSSLDGLQVLSPESVLDREPGSFFIVLASYGSNEEMGRICEAAGLSGGRDFWPPREEPQFYFKVDVGGTCNLRCISCDRGNDPDLPHLKPMPFTTFRLVLDKILEISPLMPSLHLYMQSEPFLNPELPEIIREIQGRGLAAILSTNLICRFDFSEIVKARPRWFRVSASGWGANYEVTHTGAKWDLFLANLYRLKELRDEHYPEMEVELFYHLYRHSCGEDRQRMKSLCRELGFTYQEVLAYLQPADHILAVKRGESVNEAVRQTMDLQIVSIKEVLPLLEADRDQPCGFETLVSVYSDLRLERCCLWATRGEPVIPHDFLHCSREDLINACRKREKTLCRVCRSVGIHRLMSVYGSLYESKLAEFLEAEEGLASRRLLD